MNPRKSLAELELTGNVGNVRRALARDPIFTPPEGFPTPPDSLSRDELAEWEKVCALLSERRALTPADATAIELYCVTLVAWRNERILLEQEGSLINFTMFKSGHEITNTVPNPRSKVCRNLARQLLDLAKELGITPRSRAAVKTLPPKAAPRPGTVAYMEAKSKTENEKNGE